MSDLHAADARYHKNCYRDFVNDRMIKAARNQFDQVSSDEKPFNSLLRNVRTDKEKIWTSTELMEYYVSEGDTEKNSSRLVSRIK